MSGVTPGGGVPAGPLSSWVSCSCVDVMVVATISICEAQLWEVIFGCGTAKEVDDLSVMKESTLGLRACVSLVLIPHHHSAAPESAGGRGVRGAGPDF